MSKFLTTTQEVLDEIDSIIRESPNKIGISSCTIKIIMDAVFNALNSLEGEYNPSMVVNGLTGKENLGSSFLYQINRLSNHIRIERTATHNIIVGEKRGLFISEDGNRNAENQLMAVMVEDEAATQMQEYIQGLWGRGLPLRLG